MNYFSVLLKFLTSLYFCTLIDIPSVGGDFTFELNQLLPFLNVHQDLIETSNMKICTVNGQAGSCILDSLTSIICKPFGLEISKSDLENRCTQTQSCCYSSSLTTENSLPERSPIEPRRGARVLSSTFGFQSCEFEQTQGICVPSMLAKSLCSLFSLKVADNGCPNPASIFYESCCYVPHQSTSEFYNNATEINKSLLVSHSYSKTAQLFPDNSQQVAASVKVFRQGRIIENICGKMGSGSIGDNVSAYGRTSRLLGGKNTNVGSHCWHALLLKSYNRRYFCAGTLIDKDWVLTAAHCVYRLDPKDVLIRLGEWDMNSASETPGHHDHRVSKVITHPLYNSKSLENDVALLKLDSTAELNQSNICLACLPNHIKDSEEKTCLIAGFGQNEDGAIVHPVLKEIEVTTVNDFMCETELNSTGALDKNFTLKTKSFLCAAGVLHGEDVCSADGGSPMMCKLNDTYHVIGIVSWGIGCGKPNVPGVYVKVANFVADINKMMDNF